MTRCARGMALAISLFLLASLGLPGPMAAQGDIDTAAIDAYITSEMDDSRIPGVAVAIVDGGQIAYSAGYGEAGDGRDVTPATLFPIGSLTKSMTALAIMQLVEAGRLDLDAPVQTFIPWFRVADADASARITLRHLLTQVSGLSRHTGIQLVLERSDASLEETVRSLATASLNRPVGESYEYSNANFAVLSLVVQLVSGQPFGDYLQERVFTPLGMTSATTSLAEARERGLTDVHRFWFGFPVATAPTDLPGHEPAFVSAEDMAAYLAMYLNGGTHNGVTLLSPRGIAQLLTPATNEASRALLGTEFTFRYGMGWFAGPFGAAGNALWHLGELPSFNAWMVLLPEQDRAVVVLTNAGSQLPLAGANSVMSRIPLGVVDILAGEAPPEGMSLARFYVFFDLAVVAIVAVQLWALVRLLRRPGGRFRAAIAAVPLTWEIGLGLAILLGYPVLSGFGWRGSMVSMPDLTIVLLVVAGLWLLTGVARLVRLVQARRAVVPLPVRPLGSPTFVPPPVTR